MMSGKTGKTEKTFLNKNGRRDAAASFAAVFLCLLFVGFFSAFFASDTGNIEYPLEGNVAGYNPYVQQFDALMKRQTHLDIEPDPRLAELDNPYDPAQRSKAGVSSLWDRAYFEGKYYSNFGIAPVITVYMPFYLLTGRLPGTGTVMVVFLILAAVFMPLTVTSWAEEFAPGVPRWLRTLAGVAVFHCSLISLIARGRTPFYYLAAVAAVSFISVFFFLCVAAYRKNSEVGRCVLYALAGVFFGLSFQSRLSVAVIAAFLVVPGLWFFVIGREREGKRLVPVIGELASLGVPVALFFAGSMIFNAMRFSGPLDFGHSWQLTVTDNQTLKIRLSDVPFAVFHYILEMPADSEVYPYINFSYVRFANYGHYQYRDAGFGIFAVPLLWTLLASPAVILSRSFTPRRRIFTAAAAAGIFSTALIDFCMGGIIYRYTADMTLVGSIFSVIIIFSLCERIKEGAGGVTRWYVFATYIAAALFFAVSVWAALRLFVINDNGNVMQYSEEVSAWLQKYVWFPAPRK